MDNEQIRNLATLAQLAVDDAAVPGVAADLTRVLALVESLNAVDTTGIEPMAHPVADRVRLRDDVVVSGESREALQAPAPAVQDGYFLVPSVIP